MRNLWTRQILVPWFRVVWTRWTRALLDLIWLLSIERSRHQTTCRKGFS